MRHLGVARVVGTILAFAVLPSSHEICNTWPTHTAQSTRRQQNLGKKSPINCDTHTSDQKRDTASVRFSSFFFPASRCFASPAPG